MEFVEGQTLRGRLRNSRVTVREALQIAIQIAAAASAAHAVGHRSSGFKAR